MKIIVFGATGMVGKQLVKQALYNGDDVKAYGRNVFIEGLPDNNKLELIQGALFDDGELFHALKGCDAVLAALGGATDGTDKTRSLGMKHIVTQMEKAGIKRIVALGGMGVLEDAEGKMIMEQEDFPPQYIEVSKEHKKALGYLQASNLRWTFVCPAMIQDGEASGIFNTSINQLPDANHHYITSGNLALCMLKALKQDDFIKEKIGISS